MWLQPRIWTTSWISLKTIIPITLIWTQLRETSEIDSTKFTISVMKCAIKVTRSIASAWTRKCWSKWRTTCPVKRPYPTGNRWSGRCPMLSTTLEQHEILEISIALGIPTTIQGLPLLGMPDRDQDQAREQRRIVTRLNKWVSSSYVPIKDKKSKHFNYYTNTQSTFYIKMNFSAH